MQAVDLSNMDSNELDALIARAAQRRAQLEPKIPEEAPGHVYGERHPAWNTFLQNEDTVIQFRHSGFGWIAFGLSPNHRAQLLGLLLHQALYKPELSKSAEPKPPPANG